jgi:hypothetical protein
MVGNLQQQGDNHSFDYFSGFQDNVDFGHTVEFLDANFGVDFTYGDAFDFEFIGSWGFEYNNVLCDFSVERVCVNLVSSRERPFAILRTIGVLWLVPPPPRLLPTRN